MPSQFDLVAFLRGMNVGGHRLTNDRLVDIFDSLGIPDAVAYQASGNVLFNSPSPAGLGRQGTAELEHRLSAGLEAELGYAVPVIVRSATQLDEVLTEATEAQIGVEPPPAGKPQVVFFRDPMTLDAQTAITAATPDGDQLAIGHSEVHWWPDGGLADSEMDWTRLDRKFGPFTMRTLGTVERIAKKLVAPAR